MTIDNGAEKISSWYDTSMQSNDEFPAIQWYIHKVGKIPHTFFIRTPLHLDFAEQLINEGFEDVNSLYNIRKKNNKVVRSRAVIMKDDIMVMTFMRDEDVTEGVRIYFQDKEKADFIIDRVNQQLEKERGSDVWLVAESGFFDLKRIDVPNPIKDDDLLLHYGNSFETVHNKILTTLNDDSSRFVLLHGKPGTGKTNYIRHLVNVLPKKFVYVPSLFLENMSAPNITEFLFDNKGAIFIVEDAERVMMSRKSNPNSPVNAFLNLTDGFLSDAFKFKFIVTVNGNIKELDEALLRKGRLAVAYEFNQLNETDSNALAKHIGSTVTFKGSNSLADIYNTEDVGLDTAKSVGFQVGK